MTATIATTAATAVTAVTAVTAMTPEHLVMQILAGGLLGMLGQGVRVIAGLKKASDSAAASGQSLAEVFEGGTLMTSLLIGFVAGALAMLGAGYANPVTTLDHATIMAIVGAGYAGADFIEAFMSKAMPASSAGPAVSPLQPPMG